jgi:hypothetical protein
MAEVTLHCEEKWTLMFMGKVIALDKVGVHDNFQFNRKSLHVLFETIRHLRYCTGVHQVNSDEENLPPFFKEHVSSISDENHDIVCYRVKSCLNVLPVISSNNASLSCINCKKLIRNNKHTETNRENVPSVINNEIQSTCVPKEKEDITVVNDDLDTDKYINDNTESDHKFTCT